MRFTLQTLATLLAFVSPIFADEATAPKDSHVVQLNAKNFEKFLSENPLVLAEFYAPWCGHCKALGPQLVEAAATLKDKDIPLAQIDCETNTELCQTHGIRGYPTIKVFRGVDDSKPYEGARKAEAITSYMLKQALPAVQPDIDSAAFSKTLEETKEPVIVQVLPKADAALDKIYAKIADSKRDKFTFLSTTDEDLIAKYDVKKPTYLVFRSGSDEEPAVFNETVETEALTKFIEDESKPYFGEINGETFQQYMGAKVPLAYLFYTSPEERAEWAPKITKLAKEYRGKINFVGLDAPQFGRHAENLNQEEKFPLFAIHDLEKNHKYGLDQSKTLVLDDVEKLVKDFVAGTAEINVKSEDIPETQPNNVYTLVGHTHDEFINDEAKDVLVMYHATWCGHCKKLAPVYEELAAVYKKDKNASDKVLIASIEATQNDVDVELEGFPTLLLYPAGDKAHPVTFEKQRDLESLAEFIKELGTYKVDGNSLKKAQDESSEVDEEDDDEEEDAAHDEL